MSSYSEDRDHFMVTMTKNGVRLEDARTVLRYAATLDRLAVAQCNGDYPADNGDGGALCEPCGRTWRGGMARGVCLDCRTEAKLVKLLEPYKIRVDTSGDPRGYIVKLHLPQGQHNTWGGDADGYGVPTRGR